MPDQNEALKSLADPGLSADVLRAAAENSPDAVFVKDLQGKYLYANAAALRILGHPLCDVIGKRDDCFFPPDESSEIFSEDQAIVRDGVVIHRERIVTSASVRRTYKVRKSAFRDSSGEVIGVAGFARNITAQRQFEWSLKKQQLLLEHVAQGRPLNEILDELVALIEAECPGVLGSFLLLEPDGKTLRVGSGRSLPDAYNKAIDGIQAEPKAGSCGTAVFRGEPVRVHDIQSDPLWDDYRELAAQFGLRSCWSMPIRSYNGQETEILGTFALYARELGVLNVRLDDAIKRIEHLSSLAIDHYRNQRRILENEARLKTFINNTADAFFLLQRGGEILDVNDRACQQLGYSREELIGATPLLFDTGATPERIQEVGATMDRGESVTLESRYRHKNGSEFPVELRISPFSQNENRLSVATVRDITERQQSEEKLRHQQALLQESQSLSHLGSFEWEIRSNRLTWSDELYRIFGYEPGECEVTLDRFLSHVHPEDQSQVEGAIQTASRTGAGYRTEERIQRTDGTERTLASVGKVLTDESGTPTKIIGACQDVTEQKRAAADLESSQRLVSALSQASPLTVYVFDVIQQRILYSNFQLLRDLGYTDILLTWGWENISALIHPDDLQRLFQLLSRWENVQDGVILESEYRLRDSEGRWRWIAGRDTVLERTPEGKVSQVIGTAHDITSRKESELQMQQTVSRMLATLESTADGILVVDLKGRILDFNHQFLLTWGMPLELVNEGRHEDLVATFNEHDGMQQVLQQLKDPETFVQRVTEIYATPDVATFDVMEFRDGRVVERYSQPQRIDGRPVGRVWSFRDVTARRSAERALQLTQFTVDRAVDSVFWVNPKGVILYVNEAACRTLGYERSELVGRTVPEIDQNFPPEQWPVHWEDVKQRGSFTFGSEHLTKQGKVIFTEVTVNYLQYEGHEYNCAVMRDITQRRQTEEQRDRLWNQSPDLLFIGDFNGSIFQANPAWSRVLQWTEEDLQHHLWIDFVHTDDREQTLSQLQLVVLGQSVTDIVHRFRDQKGEWHWLSWNIIPVLSENVLYGFGRDVTESRHLAEQFQQSQKMEAIGRLAGGVAHDFNNLLTVINGYSEMLLTDITLDEPYRDPVAEIRRSGERAAELTSQLLAFSCRSLVAPRILNLNQIVESTGRMLKRLIGEDIQLIIRECENLPPIVGDQGKLEQVLLNLAVNSRDAMPHGGRLFIETDHVTVVTEGPHSDETDVSPGNYSCLRVIDTGEGMTDDIRARIFEPFFTTKEVGKGTGLGLSVVHGIVSQFGGSVFVDSTPGQGTTMTLYFPVAAAGEEVSVPEPRLVDGRGCETLLLVEDDDAVRTISLIALENAGFKVLAANSAASAIALAKPQIAQVDLLITDVVMPRMGGRELVEAIHALRADIPVLYISGYTKDRVPQDGARVGFLQKPFTPLALARKAREVLDAACRTS